MNLEQLAAGLEEITARKDVNDLLKLQKFTKLLSAKPQKVLTKNNVKYIPISYLEALLDTLFFGLWSVEVVEQKQVLNEVTVSLHLIVTNPITGDKVKRAGFASVPIMQNRGATLETFNQTKKPNALETCLPKAAAQAFKNACKKLGKVFGRDLSRKEEGVADAPAALIKGVEILTPEVEEEIAKATTAEEVTKIFDAKPELHKNDTFVKRVFSRRTELINASKQLKAG